MQCELNDIETPDGGGDHASAVSTPGASSSPQSSVPQTHLSTSSNNSTDGLRDNVPCLKYYNFLLSLVSASPTLLLLVLIKIIRKPFYLVSLSPLSKSSDY